jgi:hypothetical protein
MTYTVLLMMMMMMMTTDCLDHQMRALLYCNTHVDIQIWYWNTSAGKMLKADKKYTNMTTLCTDVYSRDLVFRKSSEIMKLLSWGGFGHIRKLNLFLED